jgi:hypothetical protein
MYPFGAGEKTGDSDALRSVRKPKFFLLQLFRLVKNPFDVDIVFIKRTVYYWNFHYLPLILKIEQN